MISKDAIAIGGAVLLLVGSFLIAGLVYWALFILCVGLILGAFEFYLWLTRDESLSSQFWEFKEKHKRFGWFLLFLLAAFFIFLLIHLGGVSLN